MFFGYFIFVLFDGLLEFGLIGLFFVFEVDDICLELVQKIFCLIAILLFFVNQSTQLLYLDFFALQLCLHLILHLLVLPGQDFELFSLIVQPFLSTPDCLFESCHPLTQNFFPLLMFFQFLEVSSLHFLRASLAVLLFFC